MVDLFAWMEEPCNCGNVYSHPDGGCASCAYCDGAVRMREEFERLFSEGGELRNKLFDCLFAIRLHIDKNNLSTEAGLMHVFGRNRELFEELLDSASTRHDPANEFPEFEKLGTVRGIGGKVRKLEPIDWNDDD